MTVPEQAGDAPLTIELFKLTAPVPVDVIVGPLPIPKNVEDEMLAVESATESAVPVVEELPLNVLFVISTVALALARIAPPLEPDELPLSVLLVMVSVPSEEMAPAPSAVFPISVLFVMVMLLLGAFAKRAPPARPVTLPPLRVRSSMVRLVATEDSSWKKRKLGVAGAEDRWIVAPLPSMVSVEGAAGRDDGGESGRQRGVPLEVERSCS